MFRYDRGLGDLPKLDEAVTIWYTDSELDGLTGFIAGFSSSMNYIAIVVLDEKLSSGESAISIPVVCLSNFMEA